MGLDLAGGGVVVEDDGIAEDTGEAYQKGGEGED